MSEPQNLILNYNYASNNMLSTAQVEGPNIVQTYMSATQPNPLPSITMIDLYNLLQDLGAQKIILDVRGLEIYEQSHVRTAFKLKIEEVLQKKNSVELEDLKDIICQKVYDAGGGINGDDWITKDEAKSFRMRGLVYSDIIVYDDEGKLDGLAAQIARLLVTEGKTKRVRLLEGGFNSFSARYPYLCTSKTLQKKSVEGALPSEIIPDFLFLGSYENATNKEILNKLNISHVLTVAAELDLQNPPDLVWRHIRVNDTTGDDIAQHLSTAFQFIDEAKIAHGRVLVHCAMGISRSSSVVIGYLIKYHDWPYDQAYDFVKQRRSTIKPNAAFVTQLKVFATSKTLTTQ